MKALKSFQDVYDYVLNNDIEKEKMLKIIFELVYNLESHEPINIEESMKNINEIFLLK